MKKNQFKIAQIVYITFLREGQMYSLELVVVAVNSEEGKSLACDNEGNNYEITHNENGTAYVDTSESEFVDYDNIVTAEPVSAIVVTAIELLTGEVVHYLEQEEAPELEMPMVFNDLMCSMLLNGMVEGCPHFSVRLKNDSN